MSRIRAIAVVIGLNLPGRVVEDDGRDAGRHLLVLGKQTVQLAGRELTAEPAEAGEEDQLELGDDRPRHAQEEVVEAPVLEVILDARPADPAHAPVDDEDLPVIDVP